MNKKSRVAVSILVGIVLVVIAVVYWTTPTGSLPTYFPGYTAGGTGFHVKHGVAAFVVGLAAFAYAWFQSSSKKKN